MSDRIENALKEYDRAIDRGADGRSAARFMLEAIDRVESDATEDARRIKAIAALCDEPRWADEWDENGGYEKGACEVVDELRRILREGVL